MGVRVTAKESLSTQVLANMDPLLNEYIGHFAGFLCAISLVPQTHKVIMEGKSDLSLAYLFLQIAYCVLFIIYAWNADVMPSVVANGSCLVNTLIILAYSFKPKQRAVSYNTLAQEENPRLL